MSTAPTYPNFDYVWLDIWTFENFNFTRKPLGRIIVALPQEHKAGEIFRDLVRSNVVSTDGIVELPNPVTKLPRTSLLTFKNCPFHSYTKGKAIYGGDVTQFNGGGGANPFDPNNYPYQQWVNPNSTDFDEPFVVGATPGPYNTFDSKFFFTLAPCPDFKGSAIQIGQIFDEESIEVLKEMTKYPPRVDTAHPEQYLSAGTFIHDCGFLREDFARELRRDHHKHTASVIDYDRQMKYFPPIPRMKSISNVYREFFRGQLDRRYQWKPWKTMDLDQQSWEQYRETLSDGHKDLSKFPTDKEMRDKLNEVDDPHMNRFDSRFGSFKQNRK